MTTLKQIAANRRNAQNSTGPKTPAGKRTVSRNAITHGLSAARAVVLPEEQEEFARFAEALHCEWIPEGARERFHWERLLDCAWRLQRVARIETSVLLGMCRKEQESGPADDQILGQAYTRGFPVLNTLARHERQIERSLQQAHRELELLQYARLTEVHPFYARNVRKFLPPGAVRRQEEGRFPRNHPRRAE
jgi:hypothetical protein